MKNTCKPLFSRIVNYLKTLLSDEKNDVLFIGYQATDTLVRDIFRHHDKPNGYVIFDGVHYFIKAKVQQINGYSAYAEQRDLLNFIKRMHIKPKKLISYMKMIIPNSLLKS